MKMHQCLDADGSLLKGVKLPGSDVLLKMYRYMQLVRLLDERMVALQRQGRIGFYGTALGEEGAVIGSAAALQEKDWVFPALRQGGVLLYRGMPLKDFICQVFGNSGDLHKGHQMPCHFSDRRFRQVAWSSCIATQLPHAVGVAYAAKYKKESVVAVVYLGDGATSEGDFHVALNFAGVHHLPVVFFCQNNQWAISVPRSHQTASESIAVKGIAYGIEGAQVDGNDVLACRNVTLEALNKARLGKGATLIEAVTYRLGSHSTSDDPTLYRDNKEGDLWLKRDPIVRFKKFLESKKMWNEEQDAKLSSQLSAEINQAIEEVEHLPPQAQETLFEDIYASENGMEKN